MNPNDQPTDHSSEQHPGSSPDNPAAPDGTMPALPTPTPGTVTPPQAPEPSQNLYRPEANVPATIDAPVEEYADSAVQPADLRMQDNGQEVDWTAPEFIAEDKSPAWYMALAGVSVVVVAAVYFISRDLFNTIIVAVAAVIFGVAAGRRPRHMNYGVDSHGIMINSRHYAYEDFRSFSFVEEGPHHYLVFMPLKRFMPPLTVYFDPVDQERISDVVSPGLPQAPYQHALTERLMRRIRF
jgi:hypothetical protein